MVDFFEVIANVALAVIKRKTTRWLRHFRLSRFSI